MTAEPLTPEERHWRDGDPEHLGAELADKHLNAIRARLDAITPGDWTARIDTDGSLIVTTDDPKTSAVIWCGDIETSTGRDHSNHEFIAHAPEDLRALLDRVDTLEAALRRLDEARRDHSLSTSDYLRLINEVLAETLGVTDDDAPG
jgi:hypothetical protein